MNPLDYIATWYIIVSAQFALQYNGYTNNQVNYFNAEKTVDSTYATSTNALREFQELNLPTDSVELTPAAFPQDTTSN